MEEWQAKPSESYTEIFKYLKTVYREIRGKIKFPQTIPKLQSIYQEYLTKEYQEKMYAECADLKSLGDENVEKLFEHHVLNPLGTKNFISLQKKLESMVARFLGQLEFAAIIDEKAIKEYIDEHIEDNDDAILEYVKKLPRDVDILDEMTYPILNKKLQSVLSVLDYAQQAVYTKYQLSDYYALQSEKIKETTIKLIITELDVTYGKVLRDVVKVLKKSLETCLKEYRDKYEEELVEMYLKGPTVSNYMNSFKTIHEKLVQLLKEKAVEELEEVPNEVFIFDYAKELKETLEKCIIVDKLFKAVLQDPTMLRNTVYTELHEMFDDFFIFGKIFQLFDEWRLGSLKRVVAVCKITLLTDYVEFHEDRYSMYFEILERVYKSFLEEYAKEDKTIQEIWEMINTKESYMNNRPKLNQMLAQETEAWNKEVDLSANLFALMSVFLAFNVVRAENMSTRYTNHLRCMLKNVFRNFQNGMHRFTNFQILCALESLIIEYKTKIKSKSLRRLDSTPLQREILESIRKTSIHSFDEQAEYKEQLASIEAQIHANIPKPNKFIFEKISDPGVKSKAIIICISGFTSEDCTKSREWRGIPAAFPHTEMIALHWRSSTMNALFECVVNEANEVSKAKEGLIFGFALPSFQSLTLGVMAYKAIKGIASDQWGQCNKEAITTGIYLAHILAETDLFKDYVINLMAFSLGTMVVMNCIWELERMNRHDIIYDVLLMGGVINVGDFNQGAMSVIGHKLINCYCYNDYILKYILKAANFGTNPIGLGPILSSNKKVENLNVTKEVDGHTDYRDNLFNIIARIDFNEDFRYMLTE